MKERTLESMHILKGIEMEIRHGELICVIGEVGSGKSSLLSAIIGEMMKVP